MKLIASTASVCLLAFTLAACGSDKTTVIHEPVPVAAPAAAPVVIHQPAAGIAPSDVESMCSHGYDNRSRSCY